MEASLSVQTHNQPEMPEMGPLRRLWELIARFANLSEVSKGIGPISRQDFLKYALLGLVTGGTLLGTAGCAPGTEPVPANPLENPQNGDSNPPDNSFETSRESGLEGQSLLDNPEEMNRLKISMGAEWAEMIAKGVFETKPKYKSTMTVEQLNNPDLFVAPSIAESWAAAYLAQVLEGKINDPELANKVKFYSAANGNQELYKALQVGELLKNGALPEDLVGFYHERVQGGGFVLYDRKNQIWYKFIDADYISVAGHEAVVKDIWQQNLRNFESGDPNDVAVTSAIIRNKKYTVLKTPNVGQGSLKKLINNNAITPEQATEYVMQYYRKVLQLIKEGNISAVHFDPHLDNINLLINGGVAPIDCDRNAFAFENTDVAARFFYEKMATYYGKPPEGMNITLEELQKVFKEVYGVDYSQMPQPLRKRFKNLGLDLYYTLEGVDAAAVTTKLKAIADEYSRDVLAEDVIWPSDIYPHQSIGSKGLFKVLPAILEKLKPVAKVGSFLFDIFALYVSYDIIQKISSGSVGWLETYANLNGNLRINLDTMAFLQQNNLDRISLQILEEFRSTQTDHLSQALLQLEGQYGIPIPTQPQGAAHRFFVKCISEALTQIDIIEPMHVLEAGLIPGDVSTVETRDLFVIHSGGSSDDGTYSQRNISIAVGNEGKIQIVASLIETPDGWRMAAPCDENGAKISISDLGADISPLEASCANFLFAQNGQVVNIHFRRGE